VENVLAVALAVASWAGAVFLLGAATLLLVVGRDYLWRNLDLMAGVIALGAAGAFVVAAVVQLRRNAEVDGGTAHGHG
jgi:hypothetical protein